MHISYYYIFLFFLHKPVASFICRSHYFHNFNALYLLSFSLSLTPTAIHHLLRHCLHLLHHLPHLCVLLHSSPFLLPAWDCPSLSLSLPPFCLVKKEGHDPRMTLSPLLLTQVNLSYRTSCLILFKHFFWRVLFTLNFTY